MKRITEHEIRPYLELNYNRDFLYLKDLEVFLDKFGKDFLALSHCLACGGDEHYRYFKKDGFQYRKCSRCATIFISPRPTAQQLDWWYEHAENVKHLTAILEKTKEKRKLIYRDRIAKIDQRFPLEGAENILEVGSSSGLFMQAFLKVYSGKKIRGIDIDADAVAQALEKGLDCVHTSVEAFAAREDARDLFHLALSFENVEHLADPGAVLTAVYDLLTDGGALYMTLPNGMGYDFSEVGPVFRNFFGPGHLNYFNPDSITTLLSGIGFRKVDVYCDGILDVSIVENYHQNMRKIREGFWGEIYGNAGAYKDFLDEFQGLLQKHRLSGNMTVVAQK